MLRAHGQFSASSGLGRCRSWVNSRSNDSLPRCPL